MADSTTLLDQVAASQASKDVTVDELFDAVSPALLFGRHASECAGLTWGYYGGRFSISGVPTAIANGTITLTASATCYVRADNSTGVVDFLTSAPVGWPAPTGYNALYEIDVGTDAPTDWLDLRPWNPGATGGGGGSPTGPAGGDLTGTYPNPTLAAIIAGGAVGDASHVPQLTFDTKGRATGNTNVAIAIAAGAVSGLATIATSGSASDLASGTVAAARMPALTGDVTTVAGAVATTIAANAVTNAKLAQMANNTYKGRRTAGTGDPEDVSLANLKTDLGLTGTNSGDQTITLTGDVTGSGTGSFAATIANSAVTTAKINIDADLAANSHKITGLTDPSSAQDAATKAYVDAASSGASGDGLLWALVLC